MTHENSAHIVELLGKRAEKHPECIALRFLHDGENVDTEFTYAELHRRVATLAAELAEFTLPGDRALLLFPSGADYVVALLACFYAGVVAVPAYPPQSVQPQHVARVLSIARDAAPSVLLTQSAFSGPLEVLGTACPELASARLLVTDVPLPARAFAPRVTGAGGLAMLQYTSGSTSMPKGVMLSHENLMANERAIQRAFAIVDGDVVVSWLPLFHDMGLIGTLLQPLYSGVSAVLMPQHRFLERPRRWLEAISRHRGTISGAPDFAFRLCIQRAGPEEGSPLDLSSWRLAFSGAEPVRAQTLGAFADRFSSVGFSPKALYPCYGLAEATLLVASHPAGTGVRVRDFAAQELASHRAVEAQDGGQSLVSCGGAWPEHEIAIVDPINGRTLPANETGEILVRGPSVALGYFRNEVDSQAAFVQREHHTFLRTGDLGFLHEGELFVTGRLKDMIIVRGQNLYPQDIERAVEEKNEVVRKGRVIAFGLEQAGQERVALAAEVSSRMKKLIDIDSVCRDLIAIITQAVGEAPALVVLLDAGTIPLTSSGKLQRAACKKAWLAGTLPCLASQSMALSS